MIENSPLVGRLDQEFPHTTPWNLSASDLVLPTIPDGASATEEEAIFEEYHRRIDARYWDEKVMNGFLPICHRGCALRVWLVLTGSAAGTVWDDDRVDSLGLYPVLNRQGHSMTFSEWMLTWLKDPKHHTRALVNGRPTPG